MKKKIFSIILGLYFGVTLLLFILETYFDFGNPLFIIGQAFLVSGIIMVKNSTLGYLVSIVGIYIVLYTLNIWRIDLYFFRYVVVIFFPIVPAFVLFSEWNDKRRFIKKGAVEVEAICKGTDFYGLPKFEYFLNNKKYIGISYKRGEYNHTVNQKVKIYVSNKNPEKIFVDFPQKQINMIKKITIFLTLFALLCVFAMLSE